MDAQIVHKKGGIVPRAFSVASLALVAAFSFGGVAHADESDQEALKTISSEAYGNVSSEQYELEGGGTVKGSQLLEKKESGVYDVNKREYEKLNSKGRNEFVNDIVESTNESIENGEKTGVTQETQADWFRQLQKNKGFGSKLLQEALNDTGPDFATGSEIFKPFSGPLSTILGLLTIVIFSFFGITVALDIFYITIPPVRLLLGDGGGSSGGSAPGMGGPGGANGGNALTKLGSKAVSSAAIKSVQEAENGDTNALIGYFKRQIVTFFVLGICLVYLIGGQLWVAVGWVLDLMNGMLGF